MRSAGPRLAVLPLSTHVTFAALLATTAGCGKGAPRNEELTLRELPDTAGSTQGAPILESLEPYRMQNGAMRVRGLARLPDGTKLQIAIKRVADGSTATMAQVSVAGHAFDTPPLLGEHGPLPVEDYRFEVLVYFNSDWQTPQVLRETGNGSALHGPGITRSRNGDPALFVALEMKR